MLGCNQKVQPKYNELFFLITVLPKIRFKCTDVLLMAQFHCTEVLLTMWFRCTEVMLTTHLNCTKVLLTALFKGTAVLLTIQFNSTKFNSADLQEQLLLSCRWDTGGPWLTAVLTSVSEAPSQLCQTWHLKAWKIVCQPGSPVSVLLGQTTHYP